ncbi:hypothetical protein [Asticcacaulis sp. AC402]|uniref:hypothetical protein n=1 Tax=Asticcacaulis sp. AC402 TaxID=1282361 RepID=UPI0012DCD5FC|nr:hypothetical protein [Asticcacaulis sp. AC402]
MTHTTQVGPIPQWIKDLRAPGYKNVFELGINPSVIYGTEHLCGDWSGELLVLAKDFAPSDIVEDVIRRGYASDVAFRHNDGDGRYGRTGLNTNRNLMQFLFGNSGNLSGENSSTCGVLYGNACFFLKSGGVSDSLKDFSVGRPVFDGSMKVVDYVLSQMKNVKAVVCLGGDAKRMLWGNPMFASRDPLNLSRNVGSSIPLYHVPHPGARASTTSYEDHVNSWSFVKRDSGLNWIAIA